MCCASSIFVHVLTKEIFHDDNVCWSWILISNLSTCFLFTTKHPDASRQSMSHCFISIVETSSQQNNDYGELTLWSCESVCSHTCLFFLRTNECVCVCVWVVCALMKRPFRHSGNPLPWAALFVRIVCIQTKHQRRTAVSGKVLLSHVQGA